MRTQGLTAWASIVALGDELPGAGTLDSRRKRIYNRLLQELKTAENNLKD
jgi:hypothetical protein